MHFGVNILSREISSALGIQAGNKARRCEMNEECRINLKKKFGSVEGKNEKFSSS